MTLKQFFQLAAGAVIGLIIYSLPIPGFLRWPLVALAVIGGAAFAFLPIQDRPLEQWLVAFFRSIYAPTIFIWKKSDKPIDYFAADDTKAAALKMPLDNIDNSNVPQSLPTDVATQTLEAKEKDFLAKMASLFGAHKAPENIAPTSAPTPPAIEENKMVVTPTFVEAETKAPPVKEVHEVVVPQQKVVELPKEGFTIPTPVTSSDVYQTLTPTGPIDTTQAQFSPDAAPPTPPSQPNIIVGQVMDKDNKIVEGAILEITDTEGRPVRALKSNRAGHFLIVTPLPNGEYRVVVEKEGLSFSPITIKASGEIMNPVAIRANS